MMIPEAIHSSLNTKPFITTMSTPSSKFLSIPSFPIQPHPQIITTSPPQIPPFKPTQSPSISKMTPRIAAQPSSLHLLSHLHTAHIPCPIATSRFHNTTINSIASVSRIAADFWRFHIPSKKPKADSFPNLDPKETFSDRYDSYEALRLNDGPTGQSGNLNLALLTCWGAST